MGTKKGHIYGKEALYKGVPQRFWGGSCPLLPPGSATGKSDALQLAEFQIVVSITCHSAIRSVDHLGEIMVTHEKGSNCMLYNNLAFFGHSLGFLLKVVCQPWAR